MILLAIINTIFNFALILIAGIGSLKLVVVKWYRRFKRFRDPNFMRRIMTPPNI